MPAPVRFFFARPVIIGLLLVGLLPFLGLIFFAHPAIDDFDNAQTVARLGRWGALTYWYQTWSGRFVSIGFSTMLNPLRFGVRQGAAPAGVPALRGLLALLLLGLVVAFYQFFRALLLVRPVTEATAPAPRQLAAGLTLAVLTLSLNALPEPFTLLYWYSGAANYLLPLTLTLGFAAAALRALRLPPGAAGRRGWAWGAYVCLVGAVGGGEMALLTCLVLLAGLGCWLWWENRPGKAPATAAGHRRLWRNWTVLGLLAAALMLGAPGNWHRAALTDPGPRARRWLLLAPRTALAAGRLLAAPPVWGGMLLLAGALLVGGGCQPRPRLATRRLVLGGYVVLNLLGVAFMKAVWVEALPNRVANVVVVQLLVSTTALAWWARGWLPAGGRPRPRWVALGGPALVALLLSGQVRSAWQELLLVAPAYARQMQARYALLAAAHARRVPVAVLPALRLPYATGILAPIASVGPRVEVSVDITVNPTHKSNLLLAHYYDVPQVRLDSVPRPAR